MPLPLAPTSTVDLVCRSITDWALRLSAEPAPASATLKLSPVCGAPLTFISKVKLLPSESPLASTIGTDSCSLLSCPGIIVPVPIESPLALYSV
ncbi:hypothetical protein D3C78_1701790 [compost metagenome]